jgi:DNA-binding NarL/FixJ family response regulator
MGRHKLSPSDEPHVSSQKLLSDKEQQVLQLLTQGRTNKEIASALRLSPETVKVTLKSIFRKLGVENRTQAAVIAVKEKLTRNV